MGFSTNAIIVALSLIGAGSLAYFIFRKDDEDENYNFTSKKSSELEIKVPKSMVGVVIGRQGSNIKEIEAQAQVKINFNDQSDEEFRVCRIRGSEEAIRLAEALIHKVIADQPFIEVYEMTVPQKACGRIIGRNGETIRNISMQSNAKITVSRDSGDSMHFRDVVIKGTAEQIALARSLINEKVTEEQEYQSRTEQSVNGRSPRHLPKFLAMGPANGDANSLPKPEKLVPTGSDGLLEVYASAVESPDRLWLQVKGPSTVELDKLNERMTEYYSKKENQLIHALSEVRINQLVAAPFMYDDKYYRAQVSEIEDSEEGQVLVLYYLDYGDSGHCSLSNTFELRTEFLKLRFQAIECILARVKPRDDGWTEEATDLLEELTHVALWKPLTARINGYKDRPTRGAREGSPVPCVDLYDTSGPNEINVAHELVVKGLADWAKEDSESSSSVQLTVANNHCESEDEAVDLNED